MCPPIATDVDGDGKPDLIAVFGSTVEAISGKTGRSLWVQSVGLQPGSQQPHYAATVTQLKGKRVLVIVAGGQVAGLDVRTGKEVWPVRKVDFGTGSPPVFADLLDTGELAVLLSSRKSQATMTLTALAPASDQTLWQFVSDEPRHPAKQGSWAGPLVADLDGDGKPEIIFAYHAGSYDGHNQRNWLVVEVLDGATGESRWRRRLTNAAGGSKAHIFITGFSASQNILVGPDLDGDGRRDIFTAAMIQDREAAGRGAVSWLLIEASSGADGRTLWRYLQPASKGLLHSSSLGDAKLGSLRLGPLGADGHPQLLVSYSYFPHSHSVMTDRRKSTVPQTLVLSASSGKVEHTCRGLIDAATADFNGDGIPDLYGLRFEESIIAGKWMTDVPDMWLLPSKLHVMRGSPPENWRRLGNWLPAKKPFDRDRPWEGGSVGYVAPAPHPTYDFRSLGDFASLADLDGDGIPDRLVFSPGLQSAGTGWSPAELAKEGIVDASLRAYSGKDGTELWKADPKELRGNPFAWNISLGSLLTCCRDLDGDGRPEVLCSYALGAGAPSEAWLAVLSGRNGKILWKEKLGPPEAMSVAPALMDLDGKPALFLVSWATRQGETGGEPTGCELRAIDGRDGRLLWSQPLPWPPVAPPRKPDTGIAGPGKTEKVEPAKEAKGFVEFRPGAQQPPVRTTTVAAKIFCVAGKPGSAEIIVAAALAPAFRSTERTGVRVFAFHANDGQNKWERSGPGDVLGLAYYPVLADLDGDGQRSLCLLTVHDHNKSEFRDGKFYSVLQPQLFQVHQAAREQHTLDLKPVLRDRIFGPGLRNSPSPDEKTVLGLWSHDLNADGKEELVFINGDKVQAINLASHKRKRPEKAEPLDKLWEWPLPTGVGEILHIHPAGKAHPVVVVVRSGFAAYGLDGRTGRLRWKCDGPGRPVACLAGDNADGLPNVWFHASQPESTICRQALPVGEDGKYRLASPALIETPEDDVGLIVPLPWVNRAKERALQALLPAIIFLGLAAYFARNGRRRLAIFMLVCLAVIPLAVATLQLIFETKFDEQFYAWSGWYWIWPYVLSAGGDWAPKVLLGGLLAWVLWRVALAGKWKWRLAIGLLACLLVVLLGLTAF